MILREAIEKTGFTWRDSGAILAEAILTIFQNTGIAIEDRKTNCEFRELDLLAAVHHVFAHSS
jgi:hypothetical protein